MNDLRRKLKELLIEKGIVTAGEIREAIEFRDSITPALGASIVARAWTDAEMFSYQALVAAVATAPFVHVGWAKVAWARPLAGGLFSTVVPGMLFYAGLRRLPAERAGVLSYLEVLAGVMTGWIAFDERDPNACTRNPKSDGATQCAPANDDDM